MYRRATVSRLNKGTRFSDPSSGVHELLVLSACKIRPPARDSDRHVPPSPLSERWASRTLRCMHAPPVSWAPYGLISRSCHRSTQCSARCPAPHMDRSTMHMRCHTHVVGRTS